MSSWGRRKTAARNGVGKDRLRVSIEFGFSRFRLAERFEVLGADVERERGSKEGLSLDRFAMDRIQQ